MHTVHTLGYYFIMLCYDGELQSQWSKCRKHNRRVKMERGTATTKALNKPEKKAAAKRKPMLHNNSVADESVKAVWAKVVVSDTTSSSISHLGAWGLARWLQVQTHPLIWGKRAAKHLSFKSHPVLKTILIFVQPLSSRANIHTVRPLLPRRMEERMTHESGWQCFDCGRGSHSKAQSFSMVLWYNLGQPPAVFNYIKKAYEVAVS